MGTIAANLLNQLTDLFRRSSSVFRLESRRILGQKEEVQRWGVRCNDDCVCSEGTESLDIHVCHVLSVVVEELKPTGRKEDGNPVVRDRPVVCLDTMS